VIPPRSTLAALLAACAVALFASDASAADAPASPADLTDEQVVASMQKGIDFLLSIQNKDGPLAGTWEKGPLEGAHPEIGGYTALALYALLHAGESLQDNPEYHSKLNWRGPALKAAIEYLEKLEPADTYVAGLQASALSLLPKLPDEKFNQGIHGGLDNCRMYLLGSMGPEGGYTYDGRVPGQFAKLWADYFKEAARNNRKGPAKDELDKFVESLYLLFGGPELEVQKLAADLREKEKSKDAKQAAIAVAELRELENYHRTMPRDDEPDKVKTWKRTLATHEAEKRDPKNKARIAEIDKEIATVQSYIDHAAFNAKGDNSNGQYGVLGAWAIADWGVELPNAYWTAVDKFWRRQQADNGTWPYYNPGGRNGEMNLPANEQHPALVYAGVATLYVAQEFLDNELRLQPRPDKNIANGLAWINKNFDGGGDGYLLYGVERVGLATGFKTFGTKNWYKEGAFNLIHGQHTPGLINTSYTLLFLARGRNPVCFNKLQYNGPWNARPMDSAYVTRWMSRRFEKPINWQVVNLQVSPDQWMDAPILLITGSRDPKFTKEDVDKLRTFINAGGMIYSTADGNSAAFTNAMKKYASEVCNKKYEMRQLPRNHELFGKELGVNLPNPPPLAGMSNGIREIWIHSADDVGADWQMRRFAGKNFELGAALYFYASSMGSLRSKLQPLTVDVSGAQTTHSLGVALIDYSGNSIPEPGAWERMARLARAHFKTDVQLQTVKFAELDAKKTPLAHLTGANKFTFTDDDANALKTYLDAGGMLFVDAGGGNADFAAAARELLKKACPDTPLTPLPPDHPIYKGSMPGGVGIGEVEFRKYGELHLHQKIRSAALEQIVVAGKTRVLFSDWDITSGFLGTNTWGIIGYAPASAEALGRNIILYALNTTTPKTTQ